MNKPSFVFEKVGIFCICLRALPRSFCRSLLRRFDVIQNPHSTNSVSISLITFAVDVVRVCLALRSACFRLLILEETPPVQPQVFGHWRTHIKIAKATRRLELVVPTHGAHFIRMLSRLQDRHHLRQLLWANRTLAPSFTALTTAPKTVGGPCVCILVPC